MTIDFDDWVENLLSQVEPGHVTTFGAIAEGLGDSIAARAVGRRISRQENAHRVAYSNGKVNNPIQKRLLAKEGIAFDGYRVKQFEKKVVKPEWNGVPPLIAMKKEQESLSKKIRLEGQWEEPWAGFDVSYAGDISVAVLVTPKRHYVSTVKVTIPYIPTYLAFREHPGFAKVLKKVDAQGPILVDGNGILHPRRFGVACHCGVKENVPTVGVAKSLLLGDLCEGKVMIDGEKVGYAVKAKPNLKNPIYVSPGHDVSMKNALELVKSDLIHRVPERIRKAHALAGKKARSLRDENVFTD